MLPWLGPPTAVKSVRCTSAFVDDVMFSYNGANGPESKSTRMFRPVRQVVAPGVAKSAVSDCVFITGPPNGPVLFCTLSSVGVVCRL